MRPGASALRGGGAEESNGALGQFLRTPFKRQVVEKPKDGQCRRRQVSRVVKGLSFLVHGI